MIACFVAVASRTGLCFAVITFQSSVTDHLIEAGDLGGEVGIIDVALEQWVEERLDWARHLRRRFWSGLYRLLTQNSSRQLISVLPHARCISVDIILETLYTPRRGCAARPASCACPPLPP
jgi:hypothetical protein